MIMTGNETDTEIEMVTMRDLEIGMGEEVGMEVGQIGGIVVQGMEDPEAGIDTANAKGADHVLPSGMVTGGHPGVQFAHTEDNVERCLKF